MSEELDAASGVPLYRQIKDILRTEIIEETADPSTPMTEEQLLARFNVSRAPIRQALKELAGEGFVYRRQGKGTFPVPGVRVHRPADVRPGGLYEYLAARGMNPTSSVAQVQRVEPPQQVRARLRLNDHETLLHFRRVICAKSEPLVEADVYIRAPHEFCPTAAELEQQGSAFELLEARFGITLEQAENEAWATSATSEQAAVLGVHKGSALLVIETTFFARGGLPVGWRRAVHRAEEFKYHFVTRG